MLTLLMTAVAVALGYATGMAAASANVQRSLHRIADRQALFLMEVKGEEAETAALEAVEREAWRSNREAASLWRDVAARVARLRAPKSRAGREES
jgi:hypothetical protein